MKTVGVNVPLKKIFFKKADPNKSMEKNVKSKAI
jgi:hypothetical protein